MGEAVRKALERDRTIDITTKGKKTGRSRRKEIWVHNLDGELYITGSPGRRDWYANLLANPQFTFHLKHGARADLPARATPILDKVRRRDIIARIRQKMGGRSEFYNRRDLDAWVDGSPLVQVEFL